MIPFLSWEHLLLNVGVLLLAFAFDRFLPEPPAKIHPVVWIGQTINLLKRFAPKGNITEFFFGCAIAAAVVVIWSSLSFLVVALLLAIDPIAYMLGAAVILRTTFTVKGLSAAGSRTQQLLLSGWLDDARHSLKSLVSRESASLSEPLVVSTPR